ncbi:MAG: FGGY family carbohydrate kinase [Opitutaceae bacterium]
MSLLLGIDLGTSYFKVGLFDAAGVLKGLGRVAVEKDVSVPGRSELPVSRFWALLEGALAEALAQAGAGAGEIAAVSHASQANSFVLLDGADAPLTPIVLWTDARAEPLSPGLEAFSRRVEFARTVGFAGWSGGFAVAKWRWFQEHEPGLWARVRRVLTMADYMTFALTGQRAGDASTASFLGLYGLARRQWWAPALTACGVEASQLSWPVTPGTLVGRTVPQAAELLGLPAKVPFAVGGLDHHVAALGSGIGRFADVSISTGTVLAALTLVPAAEPCAGCYHGPHFDGARFYRLAFDPAGAGQLEEYQRQCAWMVWKLSSRTRKRTPSRQEAPPRSASRARHQSNIAPNVLGRTNARFPPSRNSRANAPLLRPRCGQRDRAVRRYALISSGLQNPGTWDRL